MTGSILSLCRKRRGHFRLAATGPRNAALKDRIGRTLGYEEQAEYQRIIWALLETRRLMAEIDTSIDQHGGWPLK